MPRTAPLTPNPQAAKAAAGCHHLEGMAPQAAAKMAMTVAMAISATYGTS